MSKPKRRMDMLLAFDQVRCNRCKGNRLAMHPCPECGALPKAHETQPKVNRRTRTVREFHEQRSSGVPGAADLITYEQEIKDAKDGVISALASASRGDSSPKRLLAAFKVLDDLCSTWTQPLRRPNRNRGRIIGRSLGITVQGLEAFVDALGAPTMLAAQDLARKCQSLLNEGQQILTELDENNRFDWITENFPASGIMSELGADAAALIGDHGKGLSSIDSKLQKLYGRSEPVGAGTGMQFHMARYLAVTLLDAEQCQIISSEMEFALLAETTTKSLFITNTWQNEHARVTALFSASMHIVSQLAENDATDLEAVNAWMDVVIKCRDGLIRHGLATIAADSETHYKKLVRIGSGNLIKDAAVRYPSFGLNEGLSPTLRNAAAHMDYDVTGDDITTTDGGRALFLTTEEFVDQVLAYLEVAVGLAFGLNATLSVLEIEVDLPKQIARRDRDNIIGFLLGTLGLDGVSLSYNLSTLHIEAQGSLANWTSTLASISGIIDPKIEYTEARITDSHGVMQYRATLAPYREFFETDNLLLKDRTLALVAAISETTVNGRSIWPETDWSNAAAAILIDRPEDTPTSRIQRIKLFLEYLPATQFPKVATLCGELLKAIRSSTINSSVATIPASFQRLQTDKS